MHEDESLLVYSIEVGEARKIVAAKNAFRASRLFGISRHLFSIHARETSADEEMELALKDPGAVWARHLDGSDWVLCSPSRRARAFAPQGGQRPGAGRPRSGATLRKQRCISADDAMWATFQERGGTRFLEQVVASDLDLDEAEWAAFSVAGGAAWLRLALANRAVPAQSVATNPKAAMVSSADTSGTAVKPRPGRPSVSEAPRKQRSISTDDATWSIFLKRGGTKYLRNVLKSGFELTQEEWMIWGELGGSAWLRSHLSA